MAIPKPPPPTPSAEPALVRGLCSLWDHASGCFKHTAHFGLLVHVLWTFLFSQEGESVATARTDYYRPWLLNAKPIVTVPRAASLEPKRKVTVPQAAAATVALGACCALRVVMCRASPSHVPVSECVAAVKQPAIVRSRSLGPRTLSFGNTTVVDVATSGPAR